jgi:peroxiredoxin
LTAFKEKEDDFKQLGVNILLASADTLAEAQKVAEELNFPIGYGVSKEISNSLGAWWEEKRQIIQPAEFIVDATGKILASSYSCGPLGRMDAADVIKLVKYFEGKKAKV